MAGSSAVAGNLVTMSAENTKKYNGGPFHVVDSHDRQQVDGFAFNVCWECCWTEEGKDCWKKGPEKFW